MSNSKELDIRTRLIALGISIFIVLGGYYSYIFFRHRWYSNSSRVIARMYDECVEYKMKQADRLPKDKKSQGQNQVLQECHKVREMCSENFQQQLCLLAQRQFKDPE